MWLIGFVLRFVLFVSMFFVNFFVEMMIFVVEDDINIVDFFDLYLREVGYRVLLVGDGEYGFI